MAVLRESPWYQEILKEGSRGEVVTLLLRQLARRVGIDASAWREHLEALPLEQLEVLAEDLLDFST
jgi:hypothetical protein